MLPFGFDLAKTISPIMNSPRLLFPSNNIRKKKKFHATTHHLKLKYCKRQKYQNYASLCLSLSLSVSLCLSLCLCLSLSLSVSLSVSLCLSLSVSLCLSLSLSLPLSLTKSKLHSHLITLALFPKQVQEAHEPGLFQSR